MEKFYLPKRIYEITKGLKYKINNIGRSQDIVMIYENKYVLKVSSNIKRLKDEKDKIDWLDEKIIAPKSILFIVEKNIGYYLRTYINGESLISKKFIDNPLLLIKVLGDVVRQIRNLDKYNCPFFSNDNNGNSFVHGDLCLPNIIVDENNQFAGLIDLDNCGLGDCWYDYAWLLWSLEYNLETNKYNKLLLDEIGIFFDKEKYDLYIPKEYQNTSRKN